MGCDVYSATQLRGVRGTAFVFLKSLANKGVFFMRQFPAVVTLHTRDRGCKAKGGNMDLACLYTLPVSIAFEL